MHTPRHGPRPGGHRRLTRPTDWPRAPSSGARVHAFTPARPEALSHQPAPAWGRMGTSRDCVAAHDTERGTMTRTRNRRRRSLARASFGPEWRPVGGMYGRLLDQQTPRDRSRHLAHLRTARRDLADAEARWEAARDAEAGTL